MNTHLEQKHLFFVDILSQFQILVSLDILLFGQLVAKEGNLSLALSEHINSHTVGVGFQFLKEFPDHKIRDNWKILIIK